ncbi:MAG: hypothetical protein WD058_08510 [Dehalococcoidia bacterium]
MTAEEAHMDRSRVRWITLAAGIVLSVAGAVWALQGIGVIGGSAMSGEEQWLVIGILVGAVGLGLIYRSRS